MTDAKKAQLKAEKQKKQANAKISRNQHQQATQNPNDIEDENETDEYEVETDEREDDAGFYPKLKKNQNDFEVQKSRNQQMPAASMSPPMLVSKANSAIQDQNQFQLGITSQTPNGTSQGQHDIGFKNRKKEQKIQKKMLDAPQNRESDIYSEQVMPKNRRLSKMSREQPLNMKILENLQ